MAKAQIFRSSATDIQPAHWHIMYYRPSDQGFKAHTTSFLFPDGAFAFWLQIERQNIKEQSAWAKLYKLNMRLLTLHETTFVKKLLKNKCINITKRQYGYLTGIYERQQL